MQLDRAIVIGGSIAGLLAARILADSCDRVTIIDRDVFPATGQQRRGVPQSAQPHVLFTRGYRILEELFPGIGKDLISAGAIPLDWAREFDYFTYGAWNATSSSPSELVSLTCSRPLLEGVIRDRLRQFSNIELSDRLRAVGLVGDAIAVTGLRVSCGKGREEEVWSASLVVDASGRGSKAPHWLAELGCQRPKVTKVNGLLGYATRRYRIPEGTMTDWKVMLISHTPPQQTRLGYLAYVEENQWIATLGGYGRDFPPLDERGYLEFARSLPSPRFYETIAAAEPLSEIVAHRATMNRLYHYDRLPIPTGFVVLGDAVCALCPVYGQGMTVSALAAIALRDWLQTQSQLPLNSVAFQQALAASNEQAWTVAAERDSEFPFTQGQLPRGESWVDRLLAEYIKRLQKGSHQDPQLNEMSIRVAHLLDSPVSLFKPRIAIKAFLG